MATPKKKSTRTTRKPRRSAATTATPTPTRALVLRTCAADMTSRNGFRWPELGPVSAPDWDPQPVCGGGLHGLLWGEGDGESVSWDPDARWLVVEVDPAVVVELSGKVKFPRGVVVYCGDRHGATSYLVERAKGRAVVGAQIAAGYGGTATAGYGGTATAGDSGTATAGVRGTLILRRWDSAAQRWRMAVGYIGEDGLRPGVRYRLDDAGRFVEVAR